MSLPRRNEADLEDVPGEERRRSGSSSTTPGAPASARPEGTAASVHAASARTGIGCFFLETAPRQRRPGSARSMTSFTRSGASSIGQWLTP